MRELNVFEMQEISGGYSWDTSSFMSTLTSLVTNGVEAVGSAIAFGTVAAMWGALLQVVRLVTAVASLGLVSSPN